MAKNLRCYLASTSGSNFRLRLGGAYKGCRDCGKFSDIPQRPFLPGGN
jgi:hypothetical protein